MSWEAFYQRKVTDLDTALASIKSGHRVYLGGGAGVPRTLIEGLMRRAPVLRNVEITHILTFAEAPYVDPEYAASFRHNALFIGHNVRGAVQAGRNLDDSFLRTLKTKAEQYIIYADNCVLDNSLMQKYHITFKKIPRDITRF